MSDNKTKQTSSNTQGATKKVDIYKAISEKILQSMENGTSIWQKPWTTQGIAALPANGYSGTNYRGINVLVLLDDVLSNHYSSNEYFTFKQVQQLNEQFLKENPDAQWADGPKVKKGSKGVQVVKFGKFEKEREVKKSDGTTETKVVNIPFTQGFTVYNRDQIENIDKIKPAAKNLVEQTWDDLQAIDGVASSMGVKLENLPQDRAYYAPSLDTVRMPLKDQFPTQQAYYEVLLHELGHATGHPTRLNRDQEGGKGSERYAYEELVAETTSVFTSYRFGLKPETTLDTHAAYLNHFKSLIKDDPQALFRAMADAQKASDFIITRAPGFNPVQQESVQNKHEVGEYETALGQAVNEKQAYQEAAMALGQQLSKTVEVIKQAGLTADNPTPPSVESKQAPKPA